MAALTRTDVTRRLPLGDRVIQTFRVTTGTASNSTEWIATGFSNIIAVQGFAVKGTTGVTDAIPSVTAAVAATLDFTYTGVNDLTVTIDGIVYTSDASPNIDGSQPYFFNIEATSAAAAQGLADVINAGNGQGAEAAVVPAITSFGFGTAPHPSVFATASGSVVTVTARVPGTGGNAIVLAENETNGSWAGAGTVLAGGVDAVSSAELEVGFNFVLNAQGTGVAADTNLGDLGIECSQATKVVEVTVVAIP